MRHRDIALSTGCSNNDPKFVKISLFCEETLFWQSVLLLINTFYRLVNFSIPIF